MSGATYCESHGVEVSQRACPFCERKMQCCETCKFFAAYREESEDAGSGTCHRMPPQIIQDNGDYFDYCGTWPRISRIDWCGEWKSR